MVVIIFHPDVLHRNIMTDMACLIPKTLHTEAVSTSTLIAIFSRNSWRLRKPRNQTCAVGPTIRFLSGRSIFSNVRYDNPLMCRPRQGSIPTMHHMGSNYGPEDSHTMPSTTRNSNHTPACSISPTTSKTCSIPTCYPSLSIMGRRSWYVTS